MCLLYMWMCVCIVYLTRARGHFTFAKRVRLRFFPFWHLLLNRWDSLGARGEKKLDELHEHRGVRVCTRLKNWDHFIYIKTNIYKKHSERNRNCHEPECRVIRGSVKRSHDLKVIAWFVRRQNPITCKTLTRKFHHVGIESPERGCACRIARNRGNPKDTRSGIPHCNF